MEKNNKNTPYFYIVTSVKYKWTRWTPSSSHFETKKNLRIDSFQGKLTERQKKKYKLRFYYVKCLYNYSLKRCALKVCLKMKNSWRVAAPNTRKLSEFRVFLFILDCTRASVKFWHIFYLFEFFQSISVRRVCAYRCGWGVRVRIFHFIWFISIRVANFIIRLIQTLQFASQRQRKCRAISGEIRFESVSAPVASNSMEIGWLVSFYFVRKTTMSDKMK